MMHILENLKKRIIFFSKITKKYKFITKLMIIGITFFSIVFCIKRIIV